MNSQRHINPDHYLGIDNSYIFTPERNQAAWRKAYTDFESLLRNAKPSTKLYVVIGIQGSGKSTWVEHNILHFGSEAIFFDAALPARVHRRRVLELAQENGVSVIAVWMNTPLKVAIARNSARPPNKQVPELAVHRVFYMLERPEKDEGFSQIFEITIHEIES